VSVAIIKYDLETKVSKVKSKDILINYIKLIPKYLIVISTF